MTYAPVANVVAANIAAMTKPATDVSGRVFNIGTGNSISIREVVDVIRKIFPKTPEPQFLAARSGEVPHSRADVCLARQKLGYSPQTEFGLFLRGLIPETGQ